MNEKNPKKPPNEFRYQWRVTQMGLQGSLASCARLMDFVMTGVKGIIMYIDDILVHSRDHAQHLKSLEEVLWRLPKYGLKLDVDKTIIIGARTVQYLGYTLSVQEVTLSKDKLAAIKEFPMPTLQKAVREFLGLANYFRSLIPRFSQTADPLNAMMRASPVWRTGAPPPPEAQAAFNKLKEALMSAPIVVNQNREGRFVLQTDASTGTESAAGSMGAVLLQEQKDKTERVVAYASRGLKDHEKNYPAFLLEKVVACCGIDYFDTYLTRPKQFTLGTDHWPLETMSTVHNKTLNNLQLFMLKFNFVIKYKEGWRNTIADALSRRHAGVPFCVVTRSNRRTAEDNSVPAYGRDEEEEGDTGNEDDGKIPSQAIVARPPLATPHRDLESTIGVNLQKEQDKDKRTKMVKEYLTNSFLSERQGKSRLGGNNVKPLPTRGQPLVVQDEDQDKDHDSRLGPASATQACHGGRTRVAQWRPPRRKNDDRQSETRILLVRNDVRHK
jgi:hypothetical protein